MSFPGLSLKDVEDMSLKEIDKRISFFNKTKHDLKSSELRTFMSLLHTTISYGTSPTRQNNSKFSKFLDKVFNKNKPSKHETYEEVMNIAKA